MGTGTLLAAFAPWDSLTAAETALPTKPRWPPCSLGRGAEQGGSRGQGRGPGADGPQRSHVAQRRGWQGGPGGVAGAGGPGTLSDGKIRKREVPVRDEPSTAPCGGRCPRWPRAPLQRKQLGPSGLTRGHQAGPWAAGPRLGEGAGTAPGTVPEGGCGYALGRGAGRGHVAVQPLRDALPMAAPGRCQRVPFLPGSPPGVHVHSPGRPAGVRAPRAAGVSDPGADGLASSHPVTAEPLVVTDAGVTTPPWWPVLPTPSPGPPGGSAPTQARPPPVPTPAPAP